MNLKNLRILGLLEGTSLILLLLVAMPLKYQFGILEATKAIGMIHGILFLSFVVLLIGVIGGGKLADKHFITGLVASVIPFGNLVFDHKVLKPLILKEARIGLE